MYIYFILLNVYLRSFIFFINSNNIWHWRLPLQGILNELVAAGLFYLVIGLLWIIIKRKRIRKLFLFLFSVLWIVINYINFQYASTFNSLVPISWFSELNNITSLGNINDILIQNIETNMIYMIVIPIMFSVCFIFCIEKYWIDLDKRYYLFVFLLSAFFQSSTLYADIHPRIESVVHSHILKYWYYNYDDQLNKSKESAELNSFSADFLERIIEYKEDRPILVPQIKNNINVVVIIMESFRAYELGVYGSNLNISPNFDKYAKKGLLFNNIFSSYNLSRVGMWSALCGAHQNVIGGSVFTNYEDHNVKCLYDYFNELNYETAWIHGQSATYDSQGYFMSRHQVKHIKDRLSFPVDSEILGWGLSDRELMKFSLEYLENLKTPYFTVIQTITNHHPYVAPKGYFTDFGFSESINKFFSTFKYSDAMLGYFLDEYLKTENGKESLIIITADHGNGKELVEADRNEKIQILNQYHIPLLFIYPSSGKQLKMTIDALGGHLDIMPTVLDIMGIPHQYPIFGKSLIRNYKYRYAKGNIEGGWILAENRFIKMRSSNTPMNIYGDIQSQKPGDQIWINLFKEIDDLQFWMVKQNSRVSLSHKLHSLGWKYH